MDLIPCTTGTVAVYTSRSSGTNRLPVEAWDPEGAAYVAHPEHSRLVRAENQDVVLYMGEFENLEAGPIAVIPAAGWEVVSTRTDPMTGDTLRCTNPVVAFAVSRDGKGMPLLGSADGYLTPVDSPTDELRPTGGWPTEYRVKG